MTIVSTATAKYSGGSGTAQDPYQIATASDLIALGETPEDYGKHFILTSDIDLDPNLPGRKVFDKAIIAPNTDPTKGWFQGSPFNGVFDGKGHTISHLTIKGNDCLGLFGQSGAQVKNLRLVDVDISGSTFVGGLTGLNQGIVTQCGSTGVVSGTELDVGGLIGSNDGTVTQCYSTGVVSGTNRVGGLVGYNGGMVNQCSSAGAVNGRGLGWWYPWSVGGLVGDNNGDVTDCYSTGTVTGTGHVSYVGIDSGVGGLVGANTGAVIRCYSSGAVSATSSVGGLLGDGWASMSFWDMQTSGQAASAGGTGKTTVEMQTASTFLDAGWDFVGESRNGTSEIWQMPPGGGYPVLAIFNGYTPPQLKGSGTVEDPYLISNAMELGAMIYYSPFAHYRFAASIDLSGIRWALAIIPTFRGVLDGDGHTISHLTIADTWPSGLFGKLVSGAQVMDLGLIDVSITGSEYSGYHVGALAASNEGTVTCCYSTGAVIVPDYGG